MPRRWWPASGSARTTTATPAAEVRAVRESVGDHRRDSDRQARPARARRAEAAQPAVCQQVVQAGDRRGALRRHVRRGRCGPRRRRHRPPGRGPLPDEHHLVRRRHGLGVGGELAADRASRLAGARHPGDHGLRQHQRGRAAVPRADRAAHRGRGPLPGGLRLHARAHRHGSPASTTACCGGSGSPASCSYELHVPAVLRPARLGPRCWSRAPTSASARSAWRRSGSCGWRRAT